MSIFDQLMGLSGLYWCAECNGFHPPHNSSPYPPQRGGGYGGYGGFSTTTFPPSRSGGGRSTQAGYRDSWGGQDPYADAIEVFSPDNGRFPTYSLPPPSRTISRRPAPPAPTSRPAAPRSRTPPQDYGGYSNSGGGAVSGSNGGPVYDDADTRTVPKLPHVDKSKKIKPKNPNETFLNPSVLRGSERHPYYPEYPRPLYTGPVPTESMTAEEQSAKAFVMTCMRIMPWNEVGEDMYSLAKEGKVPEKLISHIKYLVAQVVPHCQAGMRGEGEGEMAPGDYCKARRCIDWMAEVAEVFGAVWCWSDGVGKAGGHAREGGWWRKEAIGFREGTDFDPEMI